LLLLVGGVYWFLYAFSSGMIFYYQVDMTPLLVSSKIPNPYMITPFGSFRGFYLSGIIWYPSGHFQLNFLLGPTFFSLLLSGLFALNGMLLICSMRLRRMKKRTGFTGFLAIIPAVFSGGCCSIPLGLSLIGSLLPSAALFPLVYDYAFVTNALTATIVYFSLAYAAKRVSSCVRPYGSVRVTSL